MSLEWTTDKPKEEGRYRWRYNDTERLVDVMFVEGTESLWLIWADYSDCLYECGQGEEWYGPIPENQTAQEVKTHG